MPIVNKQFTKSVVIRLYIKSDHLDILDVLQTHLVNEVVLYIITQNVFRLQLAALELNFHSTESVLSSAKKRIIQAKNTVLLLYAQFASFFVQCR